MCLAIVASVLFLASTMAAGTVDAARPVLVANVTVFSRTSDSPLITSLGIDHEAINLTIITNETLLMNSQEHIEAIIENTDVFFVDRYFPANTSITSIVASAVNGTSGNKGMVFFGLLEGDVDHATMASLSGLLPVTILDDYSSQVSTGNTNDPGYKVQVGLVDEVPAGSVAISKHIGWTSCPALSRRLVLDARAGASRVVEVTTLGYEGDAILAEWDMPGNGGHVMFCSVILDLNKPLYLWPYFNYLMYVSVFHALHAYPGDAIEAYHEWPFAPIPNPVQEAWWFVLVGAMGAITAIVTVHFKRRGQNEGSRAIEVKANGSS